ncbi:MAG TPA: hypothetical protein VKU94_05835 [Geobacterales bacterium]|nr:hypothetical protein [Geobacterales bacterium]
MLIRKEVRIKGVKKKDIFNFFLDPNNIVKVYPSDLKPEIKKHNGDYKVKLLLFGQRMNFTLKIIGIKEHEEIVDELKGPFVKSWRNYHRFKEVNEDIVIEDEIEFETVLDGLGDRFARKYVEEIIEYRNRSLLKLFNNIGEPSFKDPFKMQVNKGTLLLSFLTLFAIILLLFITGNPVIDFLIGLVSWILLWYSTHDLAHFLLGRALGIRFKYYYLGLSNLYLISWIPERIRMLAFTFGIKIDRENTKATKERYALMFLAGPLASMLTPFIPSIFLYFVSSSLIGLILIVFSIANLIFTSYFSPRYGCINKVLRSLKK